MNLFLKNFQYIAEGVVKIEFIKKLTMLQPTNICKEIMKNIFLFSCLVLLTFNTYAQKSNDTISIKAVIEKETTTWRMGDIKGHAACWKIQPYTRILVSTADGASFDIPPLLMINPTPDIMGDSSVSVNTNYKISIYGNTAWTTHDQLTTAKDGIKSYSYEMRMLEKIKGQWKIVGESVHHYKPK